MKKYQIIASTDAYHANRSAKFNGKTEIVIDEFGSLKAANAELLEMFSVATGECFVNWGLAVLWAGRNGNGSYSACRTFRDGTRCYTEDVYTYRTEIVGCDE